jgi:hypothetical protein
MKKLRKLNALIGLRCHEISAAAVQETWAVCFRLRSAGSAAPGPERPIGGITS